MSRLAALRTGVVALLLVSSAGCTKRKLTADERRAWERRVEAVCACVTEDCRATNDQPPALEGKFEDYDEADQKLLNANVDKARACLDQRLRAIEHSLVESAGPSSSVASPPFGSAAPSASGPGAQAPSAAPSAAPSSSGTSR